MRRSLVLTAILIAAIAMIVYHDSGVTADPFDTVTKSCNMIREYIDFDFCVSRLRVVPGSESAGQHGHLLMTIDLAIVSGAMAWDAAMRMARKESDLATRDALEACGYLYWAASMPALQMYRGFVVVGNWDAAIPIRWLMFEAGTRCDAALNGLDKAAREMARLNHEFSQLTRMVDVMGAHEP